MTAIVTKRTLIVPFAGHSADLKTMVSWLNDKKLMMYSEQRHRKHDIISQGNYIDSFVPPSLFRLITAGNKLIGTITAHVDKHNRRADMGILIGEERGQGYGTEAWVAMMNHLFGTGIIKIEAGFMERNEGMARLCEKSKMRWEGTREHHFILSGDSLDNYDTCALEQWAKYND